MTQSSLTAVALLCATLMLGVAPTPASAQATTEELKKELESEFGHRGMIYFSVASATAHARKCDMPASAMQVEARLRTMFARLNPDPTPLEHYLRAERNRVGEPQVCNPTEVVERMNMANTAMNRVDMVITRYLMLR